MNQRLRIVAHRGYTQHFPENTLPALQAAADAGADGIELDVQFCRDGTPIVFHDPTLARTTGEQGHIENLSLQELRRYSAHEPSRFGERFRGTLIPSLAEAVQTLEQTPEVLVFVEIKRDTLPRHAIPQAVAAVLDICQPLGERLIVISYSATVVQEARSLGKGRAGWVVPDWTSASRDRLTVLQPEFAVADVSLLPPVDAPLWHGPWDWMAYEVNERQQAANLAQRGVSWIETKAVAAMLDHSPP